MSLPHLERREKPGLHIYAPRPQTIFSTDQTLSYRSLRHLTTSNGSAGSKVNSGFIHAQKGADAGVGGSNDTRAEAPQTRQLCPAERQA
jgi:hypothetical protein